MKIILFVIAFGLHTLALAVDRLDCELSYLEVGNPNPVIVGLTKRTIEVAPYDQVARTLNIADSLSNVNIQFTPKAIDLGPACTDECREGNLNIIFTDLTTGARSGIFSRVKMGLHSALFAMSSQVVQNTSINSAFIVCNFTH